MPLLGLLLLFSSLLLHSFSLAQHRSLFGKLDVADGYVDLCDPQAYQVFHPVYNVAARRLGDLWDRLTVFYGHRQVDGGFFLADLDADAARDAPSVRAAAGYAAGHTLQEPSDCGRGAAAHLDLLHLLSCDAGYTGDYSVLDGGGAVFASQRA
jgi:hypothetical protein